MGTVIQDRHQSRWGSNDRAFEPISGVSAPVTVIFLSSCCHRPCYQAMRRPRYLQHHAITHPIVGEIVIEFLDVNLRCTAIILSKLVCEIVQILQHLLNPSRSAFLIFTLSLCHLQRQALIRPNHVYTLATPQRSLTRPGSNECNRIRLELTHHNSGRQVY